MQTQDTVLVNRVTSREAYYDVAAEMLQRESKSIFLMQRSSSVVLGAEEGWPGEERFYQRLLAKLDDDVTFLHIVNLEGVAAHLERRQSAFPKTQEALAKLTDEGSRVALRGQKRLHLLKRLARGNEDPDIKADRQARLLLVQPVVGDTDGLLVFGLGPAQTCFRLRGPEMDRYLQECTAFYQASPYLQWHELREVFARSPRAH